EWILDRSVGNVFEMSIRNVWDKLEGLSQEDIDRCLHCQKASSPDPLIEKKCGACDEYYTYNF
ncbi:MAG: hypothetical protein II547_08390, partial [Treponema sp.]|nr:hypothetical protein [Treponema sp.]